MAIKVIIGSGTVYLLTFSSPVVVMQRGLSLLFLNSANGIQQDDLVKWYNDAILAV